MMAPAASVSDGEFPAASGRTVRILVRRTPQADKDRAILIVADPARDVAAVRTAPPCAVADAEVALPAAAHACLVRAVDGAGAARALPVPPAAAAIIRALAAARPCDPVAEAYRSAKLVEFLCELIGGGRGALPPGWRGAADGHRLSAAMRLIEERWRDNPTLDGLARACGLNREKLTRGFRARFGCTVGEAIAERRLRHAEGLLASTDLAIATIGYRSGYRSDASFCRAFRRRFGVPPGAFRERIAA